MTIHSDMLSTSERHRFWGKVDRQKSDGCWLWQGSFRQNGYGQFNIRRGTHQHNFYAHRVAWELTNGNVLGNLYICHTCDVPACVNPSHMFLGTQMDNMTDMKIKGRASHKGPPKATGEQHSQAKLTWVNVHEIRQLRIQGWKLQDLATRFGVGFKNISLIVNGKTWKEEEE